LNLVFLNAELLDKLVGEGDEVTLGDESEGSTGIEDGKDSSSLRMLVSTPGEGVRFALRSVGHSLAHGGPVEVVVQFQPDNLVIGIILDEIPDVAIEVDKRLLIGVSEVEGEHIVLGDTLVFQVLDHQRSYFIFGTLGHEVTGHSEDSVNRLTETSIAIHTLL